MKRLFFVLLFCITFFQFGYAEKWQYVALGDSYTIGTGVLPAKNWPSLLVNHLNFEGFKTDLVGNLGKNGWTTQNVLDYQIPVMKELKPNLVTVMIGANDWVQNVDAQTFRVNFEKIVKEIKDAFGKDVRVVIVNIPDFSVTPFGKNFAYGRDIAKGIDEFNAIIADIAQKNSIIVADINNVSKKMSDNPELIAQDGLHPSEKCHLMWERVVYNSVVETLK